MRWNPASSFAACDVGPKTRLLFLVSATYPFFLEKSQNCVCRFTSPAFEKLTATDIS